MAKKIALELNIGGVKQSVSSITELETAIRKAKEQLAGVEIGSQKFKDLQGEIRKAQNFAEDLNESIKPQDLEKRVGAYAKVGSAIVSSFAAAQTALSLFGAESEDVGRAATKAQQILTLALTAREVAEGAVAIKTVAANIATIASARAATAATVATRTLWATLAANPLTAIIAAIGLLVTAVIAFTSASEEQKSVTEEVNKALSQESIQYQTQIDLLKQVNGLKSVQLQEIEKLKKAFPGFNALLDKNNILTKQGEEFLKAKAIIQDNLAKIQAAQNKIQEETNNLTAEDAELRLTASLNIETLKGAIENYQFQINEQNKAIAQTNSLLDRQAKSEELAKQRKEDLRKKTEELRKAFLDGRNATVDLSDAIDKFNKSSERYLEIQELLSGTIPSSGTLEQIENFKKYRKELLDTLRPLEKFREESNKAFTLPTKSFEVLFQTVRDQFEGVKSANLGFKETIDGYNKTYSDFLKNNENLSQGQKDVVANLTQAYIKFENFLRETPGLEKFIQNQKTVSTEFQKGLGITKALTGAEQMLFLFGELGLAYGKLTTDFDKDKKLIEIAFDPIEARKNAERYLNEVRQGLFIPIGEQLILSTLEAKRFAQSLTQQGTPAFQKLEGEITKLNTALVEFTTSGSLPKDSIITLEQINQTVNKQVELYKNLGLSIVSYEEQVLSTANKIESAFQGINNSLDETSKAQGVLFKQNIDFIARQLFGVRTKAQKDEDELREKLKKDRVGLGNFYFKLVSDERTKEAALRIKTEEDLLDAYVEFKKLEVDATREAEKDKQDLIKQTFSDINTGISIFSDTLSQISQLSAQSIQNQLEFLEKSTQAQLDNVVGNTETAEKKRQEIREKYDEQRKQLEKQQTLSSLRFSLVQAVANAAQAITSIFAQLGGTPLAFIQSAIVAGLTTAEVAIINEQINMAQMFRKGGLVKAQGGMLLSGPTHEQGGIPLAQMGVIAEGQEAIINRNSLVNYRDLLSTINQAGGGRPLVVNSFDDTRIVEAIAEQRQKPLRAYVLQSEITNQQALSKRLDDLSKI
jgi:hypothetical protein